jgi:hypothetical protein
MVADFLFYLLVVGVQALLSRLPQPETLHTAHCLDTAHKLTHQHTVVYSQTHTSIHRSVYTNTHINTCRIHERTHAFTNNHITHERNSAGYSRTHRHVAPVPGAHPAFVIRQQRLKERNKSQTVRANDVGCWREHRRNVSDVK